MSKAEKEKPNLLSAIKDGYVTAVIFLHEERLQRLERMFNLGPVEYLGSLEPKKEDKEDAEN